jgi:hypothetical protein
MWRALPAKAPSRELHRRQKYSVAADVVPRGRNNAKNNEKIRRMPKGKREGNLALTCLFVVGVGSVC